jgi:APA family basic amino acid/polyamine antiporter
MSITTHTPPADVDAGFQKRLGLFDATMLVAGAMIGSGIFIVSADIARDVGSSGWLLAVWVLTGLMTVMGALSYAELAAMMPHAGGQYVYLREAYNPLCGFLYGWTLFLVIQTGTIAAVAVAFARFASVLVPAISPDVRFGFSLTLPSGPIEVGISDQRALAIVAVAALTWINVRGVKTAARLQTALTAVKVAALAGLVLVGLGVGWNAEAVRANFGPAFWPEGGLGLAFLPVLGAAMVGALFSMDAWNNVGFAAGELANPRRDLPFAMAAGVTLVTGLYLLTNLTYLAVLPGEAIAHAPQDRVGTAVLAASLGPIGGVIMAAAIMISTLGCAHGMILSGARVHYAMARDALFFASAGTLHPRHRTPAVALVVQAVWTSVLCLSGTYAQLLDYVIFAALLFYLLTTAGVFALRIRRPDAERPVRAVGYPWLPAIYVLFTALICVDLLVEKPEYTWPGLVIVALGVPVYFVWRAASARRGTPVSRS